MSSGQVVHVTAYHVYDLCKKGQSDDIFKKECGSCVFALLNIILAYHVKKLAWTTNVCCSQF